MTMKLLPTSTIDETTFYQVEKAKREWEAAVDSLPELICVLNQHGAIVRANITLESWTGNSIKAVAGLNLHGVLHPICDGDCYYRSFWDQVLENVKVGIPFYFEAYDPILGKDLRIRVQPNKNGQTENALAYVVVFSDVTMMRRMEIALRQHTKQLEIFNAISKSIIKLEDPFQIAKIVLDYTKDLIPCEKGFVFGIDQEEETLYLIAGRTADESLGAVLGEEHFPPTPQAAIPQLRELFIIDDIRYEHQPEIIQFLGNDWISAINIPLVFDDRQIGSFIFTSQDPGQYLSIHRSVLDNIAELLTVSLRQAWLRQRLEASNEELKQLLQGSRTRLENVSHELRSPLALIKGYTDVLREGYIGPLTDQQKEILDILDRKGEHLLFLVQQLFSLQTVDPENIQKENADPVNFLSNIAKHWQVFATNKEIKLKVEAEKNLPQLSADLNLLTQVFSNLLDNALKYSQPGDTITLGVGKEGQYLQFFVRDEGIGIPCDAQEKIFERFYQLKNGSREIKKGAGIGLALCQAIVNAHNGKIIAKSDGPEQGSTFFLTIPI